MAGAACAQVDAGSQGAVTFDAEMQLDGASAEGAVFLELQIRTEGAQLALHISTWPCQTACLPLYM
jgi:hypothetical protein